MAIIEAVAAERGCELVVPDFADLNVEALAGAALRRFSWKGRPFETRSARQLPAFQRGAGPHGSRTCCAGAGGPSPMRPPPRGHRLGPLARPFRSGGHLSAHHRGRRPQPPGGRGPGRLARRSAGRGGVRLGRLCFGRARRQGLSGHGARRDAVGPQLLGVRPEKPSRPGGRRAGGLRAQEYWGRRAGPMTCPCGCAPLPPTRCSAARAAAGP